MEAVVINNPSHFYENGSENIAVQYTENEKANIVNELSLIHI